jgi:hypothetical protein
MMKSQANLATAAVLILCSIFTLAPLEARARIETVLTGLRAADAPSRVGATCDLRDVAAGARRSNPCSQTIGGSRPRGTAPAVPSPRAVANGS